MDGPFRSGSIVTGSREHGRRVKRIFERIMHRLARHAGLRVFRVLGRALETAARAAPGRLDCRFLGEREVLALCADASLDLAPRKVEAAYARGDLCAGAFEDGALAGYCWFALSAAPQMDGTWLEFRPDVVYTYKSYVRPAYRGRGIAAALYCFADAHFLERGRTHAVICIESHNRPSIAAALRSGFSGSGYAAYAVHARLRAWCSRAAAAFGLRFYLPE
jgi:GNAT superfamily N-acetyltransferase